MKIKCDCGSKMKQSGNDVTPIDTKYWFKCDYCNNKFLLIVTNNNYNYKIERTIKK